jgi:hypothetical protein
MKAKIASLFAKIIAGLMLVSAFVMIVGFGRTDIPVFSVIALSSAVAAIFGDITLSLWLDKFLVLFGKKSESAVTPEALIDPKNQG